ncbi:hypothetical protein K3495_g3180 [Podosphaera aphanis]|nr:hypothetical protein K3495_g3180 [Podosphaera aphanis]
MTSWEPLCLFSNDISHKFALIVLNQKLELPISVYRKLWSNAVYKVAADGGANCLYAYNQVNHSSDLSIDSIIGDLDSLRPEIKAYWGTRGVPAIRNSDQDSTDFMKAARHIRNTQNHHPVDIVVLGGLGGRIDHGISVLHHLFALQKEPSYATGRLFLLSSCSISFILQAGRHTIKARDVVDGIALGENVGILPVKEASTISTNGLEWDVRGWPTEIGGNVSTSNHVKNETVIIHTTKDVMFTIDLDFKNRMGYENGVI